MAKKAPRAKATAEEAGDGLTARRRLFVAAYLANGGNATQAAKDAGYAEGSAHQEGHRLLRDAEVAAAIDAGRQAIFDRLGVSAERILRELADLAFVDLAQAFGPDGELLPFTSMPERVRRALASVETEELRQDGVAVGLTRKVKLLDKRGALELLGRAKAMWTDKQQHDVGPTLEQLLSGGGKE